MQSNARVGRDSGSVFAMRFQGCRREISWKMEGALAGCQLLAGQQHQQCVEEEFWKRVIECSQTRELVATAARFLQCLLSNLAPLVCSAPELYVGGHAAAFTNPPDSFSRSGGVSDHAIPDVTHADSLRTIDASNASASTHTGHDSHDAQKMFMRQERRRGSLLLLVPPFSTAAPLFVNFLSPSHLRTLVHEHEKLA